MTSIRASLIFCFFIAAVSAGLFSLSDPMLAPELDARRYTDYALNLVDFETFGLTGSNREKSPTPGNANSPLYPGFLAVAMYLDPGLADSLRCEMSTNDVALPHPSMCSSNYASITALQLGIAAIALLCIWLTTQQLFGRLTISWLAVILILATTKQNFFAHRLLTENLVLLFFAVLMLALTLALQRDQHRWWSLVGIALALLALTRPEYLYLFYAFAVLAVIVTLWFLRRSDLFHQCTRIATLIFSAIIVLSPWMARNYHHFGSMALTGGYGDQTIAYRAAYNEMNEQEWKAAFIYWLPGYGEQFAAKYLPPESYKKLGTDANSYLYKEGMEIFEQGLAAVDGDRTLLTGYLLRTEILEKPIAHLLSSVPLAWRGVLTGKYLAVLGLPCFVFLLFFAIKMKHFVIVALSFPALLMIALYAGVSVSIPRYNIYLIYYYGIATAWFLVSAAGGIVDKFFVENTLRAR